MRCPASRPSGVKMMLDHPVTRRLGRAIAAAVAAAPLSAWLVKRGALMPVALKSRLFYRTMAAIARRRRLGEPLIETNLGIADGLRCLIPQNKDMLIYGRPWHLLEERATLELARFCARRSAAFVDVGAHEGMFTFFIASDIARPRPFAFHLFEPDAAIFERLSQNLVRNNVDARANNVAVSDYNGRQTFYRNITQDAMGSLTTYFAATDETVAVETNVTSLAHYLQSQNIERACVKVDVETAGVAVWNGARPALDRISWLIFEISGPEHKAGLPARIVAETGWSAYYIRDFELVRSIDGAFTHRAPFYNWLFCGDDPPALASILRETRFRVIEATRA